MMESKMLINPNDKIIYIIITCIVSFLTASSAFSSKNDIKKYIILDKERFIRLTDMINYIQCETRSAVNENIKNDSESLMLTMENRKQTHLPSGERTQFVFSISHTIMKNNRILRYKVDNIEGIRMRIYMGEKGNPRRQVYENTSLFSDSKEYSLNLDEINFRDIEKKIFPFDTIIFRFDSSRIQGHPQIELSNVRLEKNLIQSSNTIKVNNVRLNGRIINTLVFPPESDVYFFLRAESTWKIEGFLGFNEDNNSVYKLFVNGKIINQYVCPGPGKEWTYFQETFKLSSRAQMNVRISCSSINQGLLGNIIVSSSKSAEIAPKKIILYLVDALREDMGGVPLEKLAINKIFKDGTSFINAYANATQTADSLPIIFTGKNKLLLMGDNPGSPIVGEGENTLAMELNKRGFMTAAFVANPWLLISNSHKGFDYVYTSWNSKIDDLIPDVGGKLPIKMDIKTHDLIKKGEIFREVDEFIERNKDRSFFIFIHAMETHAPYALPTEKIFYTKSVDQDLYRSVFPTEEGFWYSLKNPKENQIECIRNLYKDNVLDADNSLKEIYDILMNRDLIENLLFILTADHGERMYEHQTWGHGSPDIFNEVIKIPMYINFPKKSLAIINRIVQSIDLFPTVIDWVSNGHYNKKEFMGSSLSEIRDHGYDNKRFVFSEGTSSSQFAFITENKKVIFSKGKMICFNLESDPLERNPLGIKEIGISENDIRQMLAFRNELIKKSRSFQLSLNNKISDEDMKRLKSLGYIK